MTRCVNHGECGPVRSVTGAWRNPPPPFSFSSFVIRHSSFSGVLLLSFTLLAGGSGLCASPKTLFDNGTEAYRSGDFAKAVELFHQSAAVRPSSGALQNLGNSEWQRGRPGYAVLAWEQALWLDPLNAASRGNLRFARRMAQLESPDLAWYEVVSSWLPVNWWAWIAGLSFWFAVGIGTLPGLLRLRKAAWQQALAAFALALFLLSVPAHVGVDTRSRLGFILEKNTPLRLTPTDEAQYITRLQAGEPARLERSRGKFILIHTNRTQGWIEKSQFGRICAESW